MDVLGITELVKMGYFASKIRRKTFGDIYYHYLQFHFQYLSKRKLYTKGN